MDTKKEQQEPTPPAPPEHFNTILARALASLQPVQRDGKHGQGFRYTSYDEAIAAIREALITAGLAFTVTQEQPSDGWAHIQLDISAPRIGSVVLQGYAQIDPGPRGYTIALRHALKDLLMTSFLVTAADEPPPTTTRTTTTTAKAKPAAQLITEGQHKPTADPTAAQIAATTSSGHVAAANGRRIDKATGEFIEPADSQPDARIMFDQLSTTRTQPAQETAPTRGEMLTTLTAFLTTMRTPADRQTWLKKAVGSTSARLLNPSDLKPDELQKALAAIPKPA